MNSIPISYKNHVNKWKKENLNLFKMFFHEYPKDYYNYIYSPDQFNIKFKIYENIWCKKKWRGKDTFDFMKDHFIKYKDEFRTKILSNRKYNSLKSYEKKEIFRIINNIDENIFSPLKNESYKNAIKLFDLILDDINYFNHIITKDYIGSIFLREYEFEFLVKEAGNKTKMLLNGNNYNNFYQTDKYFVLFNKKANISPRKLKKGGRIQRWSGFTIDEQQRKHTKNSNIKNATKYSIKYNDIIKLNEKIIKAGNFINLDDPNTIYAYAKIKRNIDTKDSCNYVKVHLKRVARERSSGYFIKHHSYPIQKNKLIQDLINFPYKNDIIKIIDSKIIEI